MKIELWTASVHRLGDAAHAGREAEQAGFDGISFGDTQHRAADPYIGLTLVARETDRLRLLVGVTNPVTRHPSVTAAAIATVQFESSGRAVLGIGRGDSSLAHLHRPPAPVEILEQYVADLQRYLSGEPVGPDGAAGDAIEWIGHAGVPKVPVDVAASGPRTIGLGATLADRLTVNVGANPERVAWAVDLARKLSAGRATPLSLGAYLVVAPHTDASVARDLARGCVGAYAHFSGMPGSPKDLLAPEDRAVVEAVTVDYDLAHHGQREGRHVAHLDDSFVDRFGVAGSPRHCANRLCELIDLGLDHVVMVEGRDAADSQATALAHQLVSREVLPAVRQHIS
jgi:5,10-methylenetetrahydromethanopterin reductase